MNAKSSIEPQHQNDPAASISNQMGRFSLALGIALDEIAEQGVT